MSTSLNTLPEGRKSILNALKKRGELRAEELAESTNITVSGIRQQLQALEADGLVSHLEKREGRGRPKHVYKLSQAADALYPRMYSELTNELLDYVREDNPELLELIFKRRMQRRLENAQTRLEKQKNFEAKVAELTKILDQDGYLAEFQKLEDGTYLITEHNCAVIGVALQYGQACSSEIEFLRLALPDASIERVAHMIAGAHICAYTVRKVNSVLK
jgi:DeoR family transcriptional regulator, suf operon transcriptional repressor